MSLRTKSTVVYQQVTPKDESKDFKLECETVLENPPKTSIHEGQITLTHGFFPSQHPKTKLPRAYRIWDQYQNDLADMLDKVTEREAIKKLPLLDASDAKALPDEYLARASAILANLAHAYYHNVRKGKTQKEDPLPECVRIPWEQVNKRLGRRFSKKAHAGVEAELRADRNCFDIFLCNGIVTNPEIKLNGVDNVAVTGDDIQLINSAFRNDAEKGNNRTFITAEIRFAPALKYMIRAIKAVAHEDDEKLIEAMKSITQIFERVTEALDYLAPNEHSSHYVNQAVWTKTVAKFDGQLPGGHAGLSGSEFPMFRTVDEFLERKKYDTEFGQAFAGKLDVQPQHIANFMTALARDMQTHSIRKYVEKSPLLKSYYQSMLEAWLGEHSLLDQYPAWGEHGFMGVHKMKALGFLKINFDGGRNETNGGNTGTPTTETQRVIHDHFTQADHERRGDFHHQQYATKVSIRMMSENASEIILDVSQSGIDFLPGDRCLVYPKNSSELIKAIVEEQKIDVNKELKLNTGWKQFFLNEVGENISAITVGELLKYVDLNHLQKMGWKDEITCDQLKILAPRQYSVSPIFEKPGQIRLTVGRHFYTRHNQTFEGVASGYLVNTNEPLHIKKVNARFFHLPPKNHTPIIMFAAGTGISPFIGFLEALKEQKTKAPIHLFFSTRDENHLYYQKMLEHAVRKYGLNLHVIFTRPKNPQVDTMVFDNAKLVPAKKYKGTHVDELIRGNGVAIHDLIVNQGAHVYVCGSAGFANTVSHAVETELTNQHKENMDSTNYVNRMVADNRYHTDLFTPTSSNEPFKPFYQSEIAYHNKKEDCWVTINGAVYNLTQFMHVHPGGAKIILVRGGLDASGDYNQIRHNEDQQVEALLAEYKVGVIAKPEFKRNENEKAYKACSEFLEGLLKMENTLSNNTEFSMPNPPNYLRREVYSVLIDGRLASAQDSKGITGSFKHAFGPVLNNLYMLAGQSSPDLTDLFKKLTQLGIYIRKTTLGPASENQLKNIQSIYQFLLTHTLELIGKIKQELLKLMKEMETKGDHFDHQFGKVMLEKTRQLIAGFTQNVTHTHKMLKLPQDLTETTEYYIPPALCMWAQPSQQSGVKQASAIPANTKKETPQGQNFWLRFRGGIGS